MKTLRIFAILCCLLCISSCASLKPVVLTSNKSLAGYEYCYVTPTTGFISESGGIYGTAYGIYGLSQSNSINPRDMIAGRMIKRGFTILQEINPKLADKTLIINYGESGRRNVFGGHTTEITLQIISAQTYEVLCTCSAEGFGSTKADDISIAINRALDEIFSSKPIDVK